MVKSVASPAAAGVAGNRVKSATSWLPLLCCCLVLFTLVVDVESQSVFLKKCPTQDVVKDFDVNRYLGKWYENRKYFAIFQLFGRCVTADYTDQGDGLVGVKNSMINWLGKEQDVQGQAKRADPSSTEGKLTVSFSSETPFADDPTAVTDGNYQVLDTDYDNYAVVWGCSDAFLINAQFLWILTRERDPRSSVVEKALAVIRERGLDETRLDITDQENC